MERERDGQYRLRYAGVDEAFCVRVYGERRRERLLETGSLEDALISRLSNPDHTFDDVLNPFSGSFRRKHSDPGWYQNLLVSGLFLQPGALPHRIRRALGHAPDGHAAGTGAGVPRGQAPGKAAGLQPGGQALPAVGAVPARRRADECRLSFVPQG